ncbi:MAG: DUF4349 domain-containing protein [Ruminococcaceae bacterium]|nr:DUF4349 domain-containing protein [Oscillospiraceae bacterium]
MKKHTKALVIMLIIGICITLASCSASSPSHQDPSFSVGEGAESSYVSNELNRKIVYNVSMTIETDDVSAVKKAISSKNSEFGGYVEETSESYDEGICTYVDITYRVPTEHLDEFLSSIETNGKIIRKNVDTTDITTKYVSAQSKKNALMERKALLEEILEDEITPSEKLNIINEIAEVSAEIQSIELMINGYDSDVNYSTVSVAVRMGETLLERITPFLIFIGSVVLYVGIPLTIVLVVTKSKKKQKNG